LKGRTFNLAPLNVEQIGLLTKLATLMEEKGKYMKSHNKRLHDGKNKEEGENAITRSLPHDKKLMQINVSQNTLHCNVDSHEKDVVPKNDKSGSNGQACQDQ
jgi:hypothetical protein